MLNTLLKIAIGIVIGAVLVKENKNASATYDKTKKQIKKLVNELKDKGNEKICEC